MKIKLLCSSFLFFSSVVFADMQTEINHLLSYVATTDCRYERNGDMHTGIEAVAHIKKKYDYYLDDIESTEDFVKYSATKSKMSGQYYLIHCPDKSPIKSRDWLKAELTSYRKKTN